MYTNNSYLIIFLCTIFAIAMPLQASNLDKITLNNQLDNIENSINDARKEQALWRDTDDLVKQAKQHLVTNNLKEAQEIISLVEFQLKQSLEQSRSQKDLASLVPYYLKQ